MTSKDFNINATLPTVSIVMVTYNHAPYIEEAITSILSQNVSDPFELIIGDDCSTDGTAQIVQRFHKSYPEIIKLITSESNVGADANFKRCIRACRGEYIAFCEGDDYWHDQSKLQLQIDFLKSRPAAGAVHSDFAHTQLISRKWRTLSSFNRRHRKKIPIGNVFHALIMQNFIQTCTLCARTKLVNDFLNSELPIDNYLVGDWPLCISISSTSEILYTDKSLATYRKTHGSITNSGHERDIARAEDSIKMTSDFCNMYGLPESLQLIAKRNAVRHILRVHLVANNIPKYDYYWGIFKNTRPEFRDILYLKLERIVVCNPILSLLYFQYATITKHIKNRWIYR